MHAGGDVRGHRGGATVVQPHPGAVRGEPVDEALSRGDGAHGPVRREIAGVEVDGVTDGAVVDEGHLEHVPDLAAQGRSYRPAVEGPAFLPHPGRHLKGKFRDAHLHAVDGFLRGRRGDGIHHGVQRGRVGLRRGVVVSTTRSSVLRTGCVLP